MPCGMRAPVVSPRCSQHNCSRWLLCSKKAEEVGGQPAIQPLTKSLMLTLVQYSNADNSQLATSCSWHHDATHINLHSLAFTPDALLPARSCSLVPASCTSPAASLCRPGQAAKPYAADVKRPICLLCRPTTVACLSIVQISHSLNI